MVSDAIIQRIDLQDSTDNLQWADDGTITITSTGQLTILKPKYQKDEVRSANKLFEIQKIDIESFPRNNLYTSQPADEVTSTNFSSTDDFIVKSLWSPLSSSKEALLAILTGSRSVHILKHGEIKYTVNKSITYDTQLEFSEAFTYSLEWLKIGNSLYLLTGQGSGTIKIYKINDDELQEQGSLKTIEGTPILNLKASSKFLVATNSDNEIFVFRDPLSEVSEAEKIKEKNHCIIYDVYLSDKYFFYSTANIFHKIDLESSSNIRSEVTTDIYEHCKIIPNGSGFLLLSTKNSVQIDKQLRASKDNKVSAAKAKRINKWNSKFDSFSLKNTKLRVYGADYNFSGNLLALLYEVDHDMGFKYKITSENVFKIAFIPLENNFSQLGSSLAVYQEFILSGSFPEVKVEASESQNGKPLPLESYLRNTVLTDSKISELIAKNIVSRDQDTEIKTRYAQLLVDFVTKNKLKFDNSLDKATYKYILQLVCKEFEEKIGAIEFASDIFQEAFNWDNNDDPEILVSESGHTWNRCAITFLPVISEGVKIDPVTQRRIIDISKDNANNYGFFTKAILKNLNEVCIYSGCRYESK